MNKENSREKSVADGFQKMFDNFAKTVFVVSALLILSVIGLAQERSTLPERQGSSKPIFDNYPNLSPTALVPTNMTTQTPTQLAQRLVGNGIAVSNVTYTGANVASGSFTGGSGIVGFPEGILLTTGNVINIVGPNTVPSRTTNNAVAGDPQLTTIAGNPTFDASVLQFSFVPTNNVVSFRFVFASEEYNEFANTEFNDVFAFFVNNNNIALLPGTTTPIAINNVNGGNPLGTNPRNPQFFRNNNFQNGTAPIDTEFDGVTVVFSVQANVTPNVTNTIKLAIADSSDSAFDSAVFIEAGSFVSTQYNHQYDFNGDNRDDISVFRPSATTDPDFLILNSAGGFIGYNWGIAGDIPVIADYDGDVKADPAVFRPSNGTWYVIRSSNSTVAIQQHGASGDSPVPSDYDGDGRADYAYWRPGAPTVAGFQIRQSSNNVVRSELFGQTGDVPLVGNYDGDTKADPAVYRSAAIGAQSIFYYRGSLNNPTGAITFVPWGTTGDLQVAADYDGDGRIDPAVFRPTTREWLIRQTGTGQAFGRIFGLPTDIRVPADYDGDNRADIAIFRDGLWWINQTSNGAVRIQQFGATGDKPLPLGNLP